MYSGLVANLRGEARQLLRNVSGFNGHEGWRRLEKHYDPESKGSTRAALYSLNTVPNDPPKELGGVLADLEQWERKVGEWEIKARRPMDEDLKIATLLKKLPVVLRNRIRLNTDSLDGYDDIRSIVT